MLQIKHHFLYGFLRYSNQKDLKQVTLNDPEITSKLDFSKPINFIIHGWLGINEQANGEVMYKRDGMYCLEFFTLRHLARRVSHQFVA